MYCPFCKEQETKVMDSRLVVEGSQVRRRRICQVCQERFTTYESVELVMPRVIKRDGTRVQFDSNKIRKGMLCALEKRPVKTSRVDSAIEQIIRAIQSGGDKEVSSQGIGKLVMDELKKIDEVAYVRFASVYRRFQDLDAFLSEINEIKEKS